MIREIPCEQRPRERLLDRGTAALSDGELLAILLRTGEPGRSVLLLAAELLRDSGGLPGLMSASPRDLLRPGVGPAKAASVLAAVEIGRRLARSAVPNQVDLDDLDSVADYLRMRYGRRHQEVLGALYLDSRHRLLAERELYRGTLQRALVEPREVLREALLCGAAGVVVFHNHPSGDPTPSLEDLKFTRHLVDACAAVGMDLLDHLILGDPGRWVSLRQRDPWPLGATEEAAATA